ncbi:MAG TPA: YhdP family protein [Gallionella sp.]
MLNSLSIRLLWRSLNWLARLAIEVFAALAILIAASVIILRYSFLPGIEQYHSEITDSLSDAIGHPVTIGRIEADWQGVSPHLSLTDVRILNARQQTVLGLQSVDASLSWMSLFTADLRFANLEIIKPELLVRRDVQGEFFLGDMKLVGQEGDSQLADWLLDQSRMVVRDALIVWVDEQRDAPPLVLQQVNLHVESFFNQHRFALRALPPAELSTPLDVRGEFSGTSFMERDGWQGELFTQLDYTDVIAWRPWLDLPVQLDRGRGALRGWLGVADGQVSKIVADMDLRDVVVKLAEDVPAMKIVNLNGRAAWSDAAGGFEVSTRKLAMQLRSGLRFQPTDFLFRTERESDEQFATNRMRANVLQFEDVVSLTKYFPMRADLREQLAKYSPMGRLSNLDASWEGAVEKPIHFKIRGKFEGIALRQVDAFPGFSGLSMEVDGNESRGRLNIASRQLHVDAPQIMREPLFFSTLTGQAGWRKEYGEMSINVDNVTVVNDDLAGHMYGSYQTLAGTRGMLDLTARLTRGDIRRAARYTPLIALNQGGGDWLNAALLAGHTEDLRIRIKGNLSDFPIKDDTKDVLFKIGGHAQDAVLEFSKDWPRIENISGEFLIRGNKMEVVAPSAVMSGAHLQNVVVTMPDMTGSDLALVINGEAAAENDTFLNFIRQSPVRGYINGFTDGVRASGKGHLDLFLHIPLTKNGNASGQAVIGETVEEQSRKQSVKVSGTFRVQGSDIDLGKGVPWLRNTSGILKFTESGMRADGVTSRILGGAARIDVQSTEGGAVHATIRGFSDFDRMRQTNSFPLLSYLSGGAAWDADIRLMSGDAQIIVNSDLRNIGSTLPAPFDKRASKTMPLRLEKTSVANGEEQITFQLGDLLDARLVRSDVDGLKQVRSGTVHVGTQNRAMSKSAQRAGNSDGVWLTGHLPVFSIQGWGGLFGTQKKSGSSLPIAGVRMSIDNLVGYGKTLGAVQIDGMRQGNGVVARLNGDAVSGVASWLPDGYESGSKFTARLRRLHLAEDRQYVQPSLPKVAGSKSPDIAREAEMQLPSAIPALEIAVESLQVKGNSIGRIDLVGHPDGDDWRMRRLNITNSDGSLSGDGVWSAIPGGTQTQVNLKLAITDAGNTLARSGYPDTVKGGKGTLAANLRWAGSPDQFKYSTLNGTLRLDAGKGQFLKMDPGAGKLLSILSMQALPMHVTTLDFSDVFSKGFQFDNIIGEATIKDGVMDTQEFHVYGSAAKVAMKGSVDLNNETQNLNVTVFPAIGDSVAMLAVLAINPAAGIAGLIADKLLGSPLDKLVSFEYNIGGTWSNPNVVKISSSPAPTKK